VRLRSVEIGLVTGIGIEIGVGTAAETEIGTEEIETAGETAMLIQAEIVGIETIVIETEIETEIIGGIGIAMVEVLVGIIAGGKEIAVTIEATATAENLLVRNLLKLIERSSVNRERSTI
jgi:hypothetical protein